MQVNRIIFQHNKIKDVYLQHFCLIFNFLYSVVKDVGCFLSSAPHNSTLGKTSLTFSRYLSHLSFLWFICVNLNIISFHRLFYKNQGMKKCRTRCLAILKQFLIMRNMNFATVCGIVLLQTCNSTQILVLLLYPIHIIAIYTRNK